MSRRSTWNRHSPTSNSPRGKQLRELIKSALFIYFFLAIFTSHVGYLICSLWRGFEHEFNPSDRRLSDTAVGLVTLSIIPVSLLL